MNETMKKLTVSLKEYIFNNIVTDSRPFEFIF